MKWHGDNTNKCKYWRWISLVKEMRRVNYFYAEEATN